MFTALMLEFIKSVQRHFFIVIRDSYTDTGIIMVNMAIGLFFKLF